jgi:purine-binding chemotaxis protein CheW
MSAPRVGVAADAAGAEMLRVRLGDEHFALPLAAVEEALECPPLAPVPGGAPELLGAFALRGRFLPVFAPERALGVSRGAEAGVVLVMHAAGGPRVGLLVDDVEDVIRIDRTQMVRSPRNGTPADVVLGVARLGPDLVAVVDTAALLAACRRSRDVEDA